MKTIKQLYYTLDEARGQTMMGLGHLFSDHISVTLICDPMTLKNHSVGIFMHVLVETSSAVEELSSLPYVLGRRWLHLTFKPS